MNWEINKLEIMTNRIHIYTTTLLFLMLSTTLHAQERVAQWGIFERALTHHTRQNPFTDIRLTAQFVHKTTADTIRVDGFYDGDDKFIIRFMPTRQGQWTYTTSSSVAEMNNISGEIECTTPVKGDRGMVSVSGGQTFSYADGTFYQPVGTTSYAWLHSTSERQDETVRTLAETGFNKLRFCIFPNNSVNERPQLYPFQLVGHSTEASGKETFTWDFSRFSPEFFRNVERRILELKAIGCEADVILFTPYDAGLWGFDRMTMENNMRYIRYTVARLSAYSNVWWSVANEWDLVKARHHDEWIEMTRYIHKLDPYHHLLSIHGGTAKYINYTLPWFTHASIQDQGPLYNIEGAATVRNIYHKPVIFDEVCYEGDHSQRWAQLSGEEMLERMWTGLMGGTYVTHGECFCTEPDYYTGFSFLATGGKFKGTAPKRIRFMREIIESLPHPLQLADNSWDPLTASGGEGHYLIYFGHERQREWLFSLPAKNASFTRLQGGERFKVEIIDTWNMTITECKETFVTKPAAAKRMTDVRGRKVKLPGKPYIMLRITRAE